MTTYRVDSYHINVAVGDSAIHLLVSTQAGGKSIVDSAVLVDGGTKRSNSLLQANLLDGSEAILPVINDIKKSTQYDFGKKKFELTSIVVTHWDEDHYGGLARDLVKAMDAKGKIPWLKYDEKTNKPLSNFYCPNLFSEGKKIHGVPKKYFTVVPNSNKSVIHVIKTLDKGGSKSFAFANFFTAMDDKNDKNSIFRVLGVNFFNGQRMEGKVATSPLGLLNMNDPGGAGKPGMYCIGVCRRTFTTKAASTLDDAEPDYQEESLGQDNGEGGADDSEEDIDNADYDGGGDDGNMETEDRVGIIPENPTLTNKFSIAAAILWYPKAGKVRCSHYFAGDADDDTERDQYFKWLKKDLLGGKVTSMKVSHHGSRSSTPVQAFDFKPKNIIISNPNGRFFHPSWELIFSAALYCRINKDANFSPKIYALKYPFYFTTTGPNNNQVYTVLRGRLFNPGLFAKYDSKKPLTGWLKWLKDEYKKLKKQRSELDECCDSKSDGKRNTTLMNLLKTRWDESAWPGPNHSNPDRVKKPTLSMPLQDFVQCLVVVSTDDDKSDGSMSFYTYRNKKLRWCFAEERKKKSVLVDDSPPGSNPVGLSALEFFGGPQTTTPWILAPVKSSGTMTPGLFSYKKVKTDADLQGGVQDVTMGDPAPEPGPKVYVSPDYVVEPQENEQDKKIDGKYWGTVMVDSTPEWTPPSNLNHGIEMDTTAEAREADPDPPYDFANWYICCSELTIEALKAKCGDDFSKFSNLDMHNSDWDAFVSTLRYASLSLTADPKLGHQGDLIPLDKTDLMGMFLSKSIGALDVSMINSGPKDGIWPGPNCGIGGFQLALSLPLVSSATEKLVFSTVESAQLNTFKGSKPWPSGVRDGQTALVLALALPAKSTASHLDKLPLVSLKTLAELAGLYSLSENPLLPLDDIKFVVPRTEAEAVGKRNAIWMVPQLGLKTTLRLQLDMDPELEGTLKKNFSGIFGDSFKLEKVWVMVKKRAWWGSSKADEFLVHEQGEMALHADFVVSYASNKIEFDAEIDIHSEFVTLQLTLNKYPEAVEVSMDSRAGQTVTALLGWLKSTPALKYLEDDFGFVDWIKKIGNGGAETSSSAYALALASVGFDLRRVTIHLVRNPDDHSLMFQSFSLEMQLSWRFSNGDDPVNFLISFGYTRTGTKASEGSSSLEAELWLRPPSPFDPFAPEKMLLPDYEATDFLSPLGVSLDKWPNSLDLSNCDVFKYAPDFLPTQVTSTKLFISDSTVGFTGTMEAKKPREGHKVPTLTLQGLGLLLKYDMGSEQQRGITAAIQFTFVLRMMESSVKEPASIDEIDSEDDDSEEKQEVENVMSIENDDDDNENTDNVAILSGQIMYNQASHAWSLSASVENLTGAHLYQFFDKDHQDGASELLGTLKIVDLGVDYTFSTEKNAKATSLRIAGTLELGPFALGLEYEHQGHSSWHFGADLGYHERDARGESIEGKEMTLGDLLKSIMGPEKDPLPDCVTDCIISLSADEEHLGIHMQPSKDGSCLILVAYAVLGDFAVQYVRLKHSKNSRTTPGVTKTMFIVYLAPMATGTGLPSIPLVGQIPQPFDELAFVWTGDVKGAATPTQKGVTADEVIMINEVTAQIQHVTLKPLVYRSVTPKPPPAPSAVIASGKHLMLALRDGQAQTHVVLDHLFGKPTQKKNRSKGGKGKVAIDSVIVQDDKSPGEASGMAAYSRTFGPLTIRNLGLVFTDKAIGVKMDAAVAVGPMEFDLIGCTLKLDFSSGKTFSLRHLPKPEVSIDGFGVAYSRPPLDIEGTIIHRSSSTGDEYAGALTMGFAPWLFQAAGMYKSEKKPEGGEYHSFFAFCTLQGPLITLEFATISGITGGYGHNSAIRLPLAADVPLFPLLKVPDGAADGSAVSARTALFDSSFFGAQDGARWVAAGLSVSAFDMLEVQALAVITSDPGGAVRLGIYAVATLDVPRGVSRPFAHVQLAIAAVLDTAAGTLKVDGQLTPASYLLDPNCHLTGGFALYKWFAGTAMATPDGGADPDAALRGSWVFTLGGYHRAFTAPSQFPSPPRLGIAWDMGGSVSLRGEAYFAVTPNVCMAGGRWAVSMAVGRLEAWFEFWADFLANLKPFRFIADGGVDVGVKFTLNLWLVTLHINIHIGATLHLEGPPIHGFVHVDFWVFGFDIPFGTLGDTTVPKLTLEKFLDLACNVNQDATTPSCTTPGKYISSICPKRMLTRDYHELGPLDPPPVDHRGMHILTVQEGLVPNGSTKTTPKPDKWLVLPTTFSFTVTTKVPVLSATVITSYGDAFPVKDKPVNGPEGTPIYARPMGRPGLTLDSTLEVTIWASKSTTSKMMQLKGFRYVKNGMPIWTQNRGILSSMPQALWGDYDPAADPETTKNSPSLLDGNANTTTTLLTGLTLTHPEPSIPDKDTLAQFDYRRFMAEDVDDPDGKHFFPTLEEQPDPFKPAKPADSPERQWSDVETTWNKATGSELAVDLWGEIAAAFMGWPSTEEAALSGSKPKKLIGDLKQYYPWAPMIGGEWHF